MRIYTRSNLAVHSLMLPLDNSSVTLLRLSLPTEHVFGICTEVKWLPRGKAITQEK